jgi:hypothetical protein
MLPATVFPALLKAPMSGAWRTVRTNPAMPSRDEYVAAEFNKLGQNLKDKIFESPEYKALAEARDDIPFEAS